MNERRIREEEREFRFSHLINRIEKRIVLFETFLYKFSSLLQNTYKI